jgi:hypothetical protein
LFGRCIVKRTGVFQGRKSCITGGGEAQRAATGCGYMLRGITLTRRVRSREAWCSSASPGAATVTRSGLEVIGQRPSWPEAVPITPGSYHGDDPNRRTWRSHAAIGYPRYFK